MRCTSGLGEAIAIKAAAQGARIAIVDCNAEAAEALSQQLGVRGYGAEVGSRGSFHGETGALRPGRGEEDSCNRRRRSATIPESVRVGTVSIEKLPSNRSAASPPAQLQVLGDEWLERSETAVLKVPSALVTEEWNYLLNPLKRTF